MGGGGGTARGWAGLGLSLRPAAAWSLEGRGGGGGADRGCAPPAVLGPGGWGGVFLAPWFGDVGGGINTVLAGHEGFLVACGGGGGADSA